MSIGEMKRAPERLQPGEIRPVEHLYPGISGSAPVRQTALLDFGPSLTLLQYFLFP